MPKTSFNPAQQDNRKLTLFRVRLFAKIVVVFIAFTQLALRLGMAFADSNISSAAAGVYLLTLPFFASLSAIVLFEYLIYKKLGLRILRYNKIIDALFTLVFTAEWMVTLNGHLSQSKSTIPGCYNVSALISFTAFSWRTLLQTLITQQWQFKLVPPTCAYIYIIWYAGDHMPSQLLFILLRGILQALYVILIFYFEHKINFRSLMGNLQQEQWMKVNEFILDNIPENIAIIDLEGNCTFVSEYFKRLLKKRNHSLDIKQFFKSITDIQQQDCDSDLIDSCMLEMNSMMKRYIIASSRAELYEDLRYETQSIANLGELIIMFCGFVSRGVVKEKAFQVFNGKFIHEEDNKERSMEIKISYLNQNPNKYILLILRDTTQRDLLVTLDGNNKYKDRLLASVSHELRTPLNGNINLVEAAIKSNEVPDRIKESLLMPALKSSRFLLHLINDILDMSQIKAQKLRLVFQQGNLKDTLLDTVQLLELHAKKKGVVIETDLDPLLPGNFCTDHVRLSQIVLNLINNSIKFTQKGTVKLSAWVLNETDYIRVSVKDSGIGMTEEHMSCLFKEFTQIECRGRELMNPTGVGLGLKIAYDLAELLGPKNNEGIIVESAINEGSNFSFLIENKETGLESQDKFEINEYTALVAEEYDTAGSNIEGKLTRNSPAKSLIGLSSIGASTLTSRLTCSCAKVLVVDDDPFNILAYEAILSSMSVKYDCVYSGRSAIDKMLNKVRYPCSSDCRPYKMVFMDEEMPGMTGSETVGEIKNLQKQNLLPYMNIVGCTAHHTGEQVERFVKSGISEYIQKPISSNVVKKMLEKYHVKI